LTDYHTYLHEALGFYVYRLVDPRDERTFYVGKGTGARALQHARNALSSPIRADRLDRIRAIHEAGHQVQVIVHRHAMDEPTALEVEAALIDAYPGLTNIQGGHRSIYGPASWEQIRERYTSPDAVVTMPAIIIKIAKQWRPSLTDDQLYERTRRYWKCDPERRRPQPTHALAVAHSIVRAVYRIERWETYVDWPADRDLTRVGDQAEGWSYGHIRRGFIGEPDTVHASLIGASIGHLQQAKAQNPITYVNC
jgi:uncharacterized protein